MQYPCFILSGHSFFCSVRAMNNRQNKQTIGQACVREWENHKAYRIYLWTDWNKFRAMETIRYHSFTTPNNFYVDMTFDQINYAMDFTWLFFFFWFCFHRVLFLQFTFVGLFFRTQCMSFGYIYCHIGIGSVSRYCSVSESVEWSNTYIELIILFLLADIKQCKVMSL